MKKVLNTLIVNPETPQIDHLEGLLSVYCPDIRVEAKTHELDSAPGLIRNHSPNLIIITIPETNSAVFNFLRLISDFNLAFIIIAKFRDMAFEVIRFCPAGFVVNPIEPRELLSAVQKARERVREKEEYAYARKLLLDVNKKLTEDEMFGIPTLEGYDFIRVRDIIRCKGLERCTQIVTVERSNIVSSYNIGEFVRLLEPFGLFPPHKSHLINLAYMKKYRREGYIEMVDNAQIPVSRRRRADFINLIRHI